MKVVHTCPYVRYWSEVLCCTIPTHMSDLEVMFTDLEWIYVFLSFRGKALFRQTMLSCDSSYYKIHWTMPWSLSRVCCLFLIFPILLFSLPLSRGWLKSRNDQYFFSFFTFFTFFFFFWVSLSLKHILIHQEVNTTTVNLRIKTWNWHTQL